MKMLTAIRSVFSLGFVLLWTFICFWLSSFGLLFGHRGVVSHWVVRRIWVDFMCWVLRVEVVASGLENFDHRKPFVFAANHQSHFDTITVFHSTRSNLRFVTKKELYYIPFFGQYLWWAGYIKVDRKNRHKAIRSHEQAAEKIRKGTSIVSFPAGTRSPDGSVQPFKKGAFMLAMQAGVPIVPVSISGSTQILPKGSLNIRPGIIKIHYGAPIDTARYGLETRDELVEKVRDTIIQNKEMLEESTSVPVLDLGEAC